MNSAFKADKKQLAVFLFYFSKSVYPLDLKYSFVNGMLRIRRVDRSDQIPVQKASSSITSGIYPQSCTDFAIFKLH